MEVEHLESGKVRNERSAIIYWEVKKTSQKKFWRDNNYRSHRKTDIGM